MRLTTRLLSIFAVHLALSPITGRAAPPFEGLRHCYEAGGGVSALLVVDIDADAIPDVIAVHGSFTLNSISVLKGLGNREFASPTSHAVGLEPTSIAGADLDGDKDIDIVVGSSQEPTVSVFLVEGGSLGTALTVDVGVKAAAIGLADVTGDGLPELFVAAGDANVVRVYLGNGDGTFSPLEEYPTPSRVWELAIGDLNGDARPDLVLARADSARVTVRLRQPFGGYGTPTELAVQSIPGGVAIGHLDPDGIPDLVMASPAAARFLRGTGGGQFDAAQTIPSNSGSRHVALRDMNNDSAMDVVLASSVDVKIAIGDGIGGFPSRLVYEAGKSTSDCAAADLDGDGHPDVIVSDSSAGTVAVFWGNGDGTLGNAPPYATRAVPSALVLADVTGGPELDAVVTNQFSGNFSVFHGLAGGVLGSRADFDLGISSSPRALVTADFNKDGRADIAVSRNNGDIVIRHGTPSGLGNEVIAEATIIAHWLSVADGDHDGDLDLIVSGGTRLDFLARNVGGTFTKVGQLALDGEPRGTVMADFTGDGVLDLAVCISDLAKLSVFRGHGDWMFDQRIDLPVSGFPRQVVASRFDGDNDVDLAVAANGNLGVDVFLNDGGPFSTGAVYKTGRGPASLAVSHVTPDTIPDLVVACRNDNSVFVLRGIGDGSFVRLAEIGCGSDPSSVATADLNEDGLDDIVVVNQDPNTLMVLRNLTVTTAVDVLSFAAEAVIDGIRLRWQVAEDSRGDAFRVHRATTDGRREVVNQRPLTGEVEYELLDTAALSNNVEYWLERVDRGGRTTWHGPFVVETRSAAAARITPGPPFPNPFASSTSLTFSLAAGARVSVDIHDIQGRRVHRLLDRVLASGTHSLTWDGRDESGLQAPAGTYFIRMKADGASAVKKLHLVR